MSPATAEAVAGLDVTVRWPLPTPPWARQLEAFNRAVDERGFMLAIAMGGGKSAVAIALAEHHQATNILVLCPKSVVGVWPDQFAQHAARRWKTWAGEVPGRRGPLRSPSIPQRTDALRIQHDLAERARRPFAAIVNFEATPHVAMTQQLLETGWDLVVIDESHRIKAPGGKQSKLIARVTQRVRHHDGRVLLLTGTPMPHSPLDLYGQFRALDPTVLGTSYSAFRARYGQPKLIRVTDQGERIYLRTPGGQVVYDGVRPDRLEELIDRVNPRMLRVAQDDLDRELGLTEPTDTFRSCQLDAPTRKVYDELEHHLIAQLEDGTVTAANAMVNVLRLAQTTSGFAVDTDTRTVRQLTDPPEKARLLADLLIDVDEPVVVFCRFHHDLDQVKRISIDRGLRYGELSGRDRCGLTAESRMADDVDVLGVQLKAGGVGVDLTRAPYCVFYSVDFALGDYLQARKRVHRPGQHRQVTYVHLLAEDTVDHVIYTALRRREDTIRSVMARLGSVAAA